MRIALLHPCFWPEVRRGAERVIHELGTGLRARGHDVRLITSHPGPRTLTAGEGLEIVRTRRPSEARLRARQYDDFLTHLPAMLWELSRYAPDAVITTWPADAAVASRWARRRRVPVVHYYMGIPSRDYLVARRLRLETLLAALRRADASVALSEAAAAAFREVLGAETEVIHPSVDVEGFVRRGERSPAPVVLCTAATQTPSKRVGLLVDAWPHVLRERPDARLQLMRPADDALAAELGARTGIELLDLTSEPDQLAPAYSAAWVSALPSLGESFGLVLAESLACGTPVVATRHAAVPEVVDRPEYGRLFAPEDGPEQIAQAILATLPLAHDEQIAAACRRRALDFSRDRMAERFELTLTRLRRV